MVLLQAAMLMKSSDMRRPALQGTSTTCTLQSAIEKAAIRHCNILLQIQTTCKLKDMCDFFVSSQRLLIDFHVHAAKGGCEKQKNQTNSIQNRLTSKPGEMNFNSCAKAQKCCLLTAEAAPMSKAATASTPDPMP